MKRGGCGARARWQAVWHASLHGVRRRGDIECDPKNTIDAQVPYSLD